MITGITHKRLSVFQNKTVNSEYKDVDFHNSAHLIISYMCSVFNMKPTFCYNLFYNKLLVLNNKHLSNIIFFIGAVV